MTSYNNIEITHKNATANLKNDYYLGPEQLDRTLTIYQLAEGYAGSSECGIERGVRRLVRILGEDFCQADEVAFRAMIAIL